MGVRFLWPGRGPEAQQQSSKATMALWLHKVPIVPTTYILTYLILTNRRLLAGTCADGTWIQHIHVKRSCGAAPVGKNAVVDWLLVRDWEQTSMARLGNGCSFLFL